MTALERRKAEQIRRFLDSQNTRAYLQRIASRYISPERLLNIAIKAVYQTPQIANCDPRTVVQAVMTAAQLGLEPDGILGHAYLIPISVKEKDSGRRRWICQLWIGYLGLIELARRSGVVEDIQANVVREGDKFYYRYGTNGKQELFHEPSTDPDRHERPITHAWAMAFLKNGVCRFEVMTKGEIDRIRERSSAAKSGRSPWDTDYEMMARKTVLRRLCRQLPLQTDAIRALQVEERVDAGVVDIPPPDLTVPEEPEASKTERLKAELAEEGTTDAAAQTAEAEIVEEPQDQTDDQRSLIP